MEISSLLGEEKSILKQLEKILQDADCCEEDSMDIKTAVAEACLNAIEHGNRRNPDLSVNVHVQVTGNVVVVEVCDHGKGAGLRTWTGDDGIKAAGTGGWGLRLIDRLVDQWEYFYKPEDELFCVKMKKKFVRAGS